MEREIKIWHGLCFSTFLHYFHDTLFIAYSPYCILLFIIYDYLDILSNIENSWETGIVCKNMLSSYIIKSVKAEVCVFAYHCISSTLLGVAHSRHSTDI